MRVCVCVCACLRVEMCWLVLQALVEVHGGGAGTGLVYPLLQVCLQPADAHRATEGLLNKLTHTHTRTPVSMRVM